MISCLKICIEFFLELCIEFPIKFPHLYSNPHFSIFHSPREAHSDSLSHSEEVAGFTFSVAKQHLVQLAVTLHEPCLVLGLSFSGKKLFLACPESSRVFLIRKTRKKHYLLGCQPHIHTQCTHCLPPLFTGL